MIPDLEVNNCGQPPGMSKQSLLLVKLLMSLHLVTMEAHFHVVFIKNEHNWKNIIPDLSI